MTSIQGCLLAMRRLGGGGGLCVVGCKGCSCWHIVLLTASELNQRLSLRSTPAASQVRQET